MGKYLYLQLKRLLRILLPVMLVAAILFGCLALAYQAVVSMTDDTQEQAKIKMGVVGTAGDTFLEMGMLALKTMDSSRFAIDFVQMEEPEAEEAMRKGDIAAFAVIPEGFIDAAMYGEIMPVKYVSTAGAVGLTTLLKDEITKMVEDIVIQTQKGIFGTGDAMRNEGLSSGSAENDLTFKYFDFIFSRSKMYAVSELGNGSAMGLEEYLLSGFCVVLLMLVCLVFAPTMVRRDMSLARVLSANRRPVIAQALCDFAVYMIGLLGVIAVLMIFAVWTGWVDLTVGVFIQWIPVVIAIGGMSFLLYELTTNLISGVLLQFFISLALCFVSGCFYPVTFFPDSVQTLAAYLPTGIARTQLAESFSGVIHISGVLALLGYGGIFLGAAVLIRKGKVALVRG
ncbi:MAG: ABC transporter permease [Oscillospiraceae bacterium]|nr:ABC transporter permease [Oscillospiraceae bacterium]